MTRYCTRCGHIGEPRTETPGSFVIEVILWLCFLVPGLIYSVWRVSSRYDACRECSSRDVVPLTSPVAQQRIAADPAVLPAAKGEYKPVPLIAPRTLAALVFVGLVTLMLIGGVVLDKLSALTH